MSNENKMKFPRSALALYVKIYCNRRDATKSKYHNVIAEATKSWLSLTSMEKLQFFTKYNKCQTEYNRKFADHLKRTKPYMKKKQLFKSNRKENIKVTTDTNLIDAGSKVSLMEVDNLDNHSASNIFDHFDTSCLESTRQPIMPEYEILEPSPPALITGEQLFNMIHEQDENGYIWSTLSTAQKRNYQNAILTIKKKYLNEYRTYLESLPPQKLISHYKSIVNQ